MINFYTGHAGELLTSGSTKMGSQFLHNLIFIVIQNTLLNLSIYKSGQCNCSLPIRLEIKPSVCHKPFNCTILITIELYFSLFFPKKHYGKENISW